MHHVHGLTKPSQSSFRQRQDALPAVEAGCRRQVVHQAATAAEQLIQDCIGRSSMRGCHPKHPSCH